MGKSGKNCHVAAYINTLKSVFQGSLKSDGFNQKKLLTHYDWEKAARIPVKFLKIFLPPL